MSGPGPSAPQGAPGNVPSDHGPNVYLRPSWVFEVGKRDALLILKALGGRLTSQDDVDDAKALGDRLTELRAKEGLAYLGSLERAATAAAEGFTTPKGKS